MKLNDFMTKPLSEAIKDLELIETKIHTDSETGEFKSVELIYKPKNQEDPFRTTKKPWV